MLGSENLSRIFGSSQMEGLVQFLPLLFIFLIMYLLMIRPQQKKIREHREMVKQLRRGDQVLTQGGILGQVTKVFDNNEIQIEIADGVRIRMMSGAVSEVRSKTEPLPAKGDGKDSGTAS